MEAVHIDVQLSGYVGRYQALGIGDIFITEEVGCADTDQGRRQAAHILGPSCGRVGGDPLAARLLPQVRSPADEIVSPRPEEGIRHIWTRLLHIGVVDHGVDEQLVAEINLCPVPG